jgi:diacylglycerol kinase
MKPKTRGGRKVLEDERASFGYAFQGIGYAWSTQRHLRVHAGVAALAVLLGLALRISATDWAVLCLTIATVIALELLNTVVEAVVDLASPDYHPLAKVAKDVAAASVLVAAGGGVAVGAFLFLPRIWALLTLLGR